MDAITIVGTTTPTLKNLELTNVTNRIMEIGNSIRANMFEVAKLLAKVEDEELFKDDGFKNTVEYGVSVLGFKKSQMYDLLKVGHTFDTPTLSNGEYNTTQLQTLAPLGKETIDKLADEGVITPDMTVAEIKDIVRDNKPKNDKADKPVNSKLDNLSKKVVSLLQDYKFEYADKYPDKQENIDRLDTMITEFLYIHNTTCAENN